MSRQMDCEDLSPMQQFVTSDLGVPMGVLKAVVSCSSDESLKCLQASNLLACSEVRLEGLEPPTF